MNNDNDRQDSFIPITKGVEIGHYKIIGKIGAGGMGEVFLAEDSELKRQVALKFLPENLCKDGDCRARFKREAQAAAKLNHPNIVTIHEVDEYKFRPYIVMEHILGESLKDMRKELDVTIEKAIEIVLQICQGLDKAHNAGIVHRDIKPANILINDAGQAKILDFGLATIKGDEKLTKTGSTLGTIGYMSPEQVRGDKIDHRSDLFSVGVILYEMITGHRPFEADHDAAIQYNIVHESPEPLARYKKDIPDELQRIVSKLLDKDPQLRYQSAAGVISDLKKLEQPKAVEPQKPVDWWNKYVVTGAVAIIIIMFGYYLIEEYYLESDITDKHERKMLAVLPFENLGSADDEYFADGITEEITTNLAKLSGLGVISRTSSMQYKNSDKNLRQIGKELKVDYILEGTIRWDKSSSENRVRINPQLIRVSDDMHLWAESYDAVLNDIFGMQSSIAREVVAALDITLLQKENEALAQQNNIDPVAYDYYLRGKQYYSLYLSHYDQIDLAMKMHEKSIEIAPDFAPGYAELGSIHVEIFWTKIDPSPDRLDTAKYYIDKAISLSPNSSEAYQALGWYYYHGLRDFDQAVSTFKRVLKLHPNNSLAIASIGWVYRRQGKWDEALKLLKQAVRLDPRKSWYWFELGTTQAFVRKYEEALKSYNYTIDLEPDNSWAYFMKSFVLLNHTGDVSQARFVLEQALDNCGRNPSLTFLEVYYNLIDGKYKQALNLISAPGEIYLSVDIGGYDYFYFKGATYRLMNNKNMAEIYFDSARVILENITKETPNNAFYYSNLAVVYAGLDRKSDMIYNAQKASEIMPVSIDALDGPDIIRNLVIAYSAVGEYDSAVAQLDYLLQIPSRYSIKWAKLAPELGPLRDHPRFQELLEKYE